MQRRVTFSIALVPSLYGMLLDVEVYDLIIEELRYLSKRTGSVMCNYSAEIGASWKHFDLLALSDVELGMLAERMRELDADSKVVNAIERTLQGRYEFRKELNPKVLLAALLRNRIRASLESVLETHVYEGTASYRAAERLGCLPELVPLMQQFWAYLPSDNRSCWSDYIVQGNYHIDRII